MVIRGFIGFVFVYACFSASSNLAYIGLGKGNTFGYLLKHLAHIGIGFLIIYWIHNVPIYILEQFQRQFYLVV